MAEMTLARLGQMLSVRPQTGTSLADLGAPLTMSDAMPYPVLPGQEYAMDISKQRRGVMESAAPRGEGGGGSGTGPGGTMTHQDWARRLDESLKAPDRFRSELEQIKALSTSDQRAIAREFTGASASSGKDAIDRIQRMQREIELFRSKQQSVGGRSAG